VDDSEKQYNKPFSPAEVFHAVSTLKNTSPGFDTIHNLMIKNLPINYLTWLLEITNSSFTCGSFPQFWKLAVILPILKPGKMPSDPKAYRPISLLSCIAKLMEKLVCRRLYYVLENSRSFSETQGGFRKRMCTLDQVARLELAIRTTLVNRKVCVAVFFDLSSAYDCVWHTGLLYKLSQCGIKGKLLCWIREYLLNRKFRVFFEGEYSTDRDISSGVPQGSILAPTLFNMMVSDLPRVNDVTLSEYADDITIYSCGYDINTIRTRVQQQVNLFLEWTQDWGLKLNDAKTKAMMFTRKKIRPPLIEIDNIPVEFVPSHRYLGMILDAPGLIWKEHIQYLRDASTAKVNVMKSVSHYHWGADRHVLLKFYKAVIRSKLDYGSVFYGSASQAQLSKLDKIQNKCLKIAIGARSTSPILSLEAESHVPPLRLHRMQTLLIFYCHLCEISAHTPVYGELFRDVNVQMNRSWAGTIFVPPVVVRSINLFSQLGLPPCSNNPTDNTSAIPPWFDVTEVCLTEFLNMSVGGMPNRVAQATFEDLREQKFSYFLEIYTDGSRLTDPETSCAAAVVVKLVDTTVMLNWRLPPQTTIMGCELFAVSKALDYVKENVHYAARLVIYSDSLSGIMLLQSYSPKHYTALCFKIHQSIHDLSQKFPVRIQYIPGHKDIEGNELADLAAKAGHSLDITDTVPVSKEDKAREIAAVINKKWSEEWVVSINTTGKGMDLYNVKSELGYWPWSSNKCRIAETALAKLRIGHVGLNRYLNRFKLIDTDLCACGEIETVEHYLLHCPRHEQFRSILRDKLQVIGVGLSVRNVLGGGLFEKEKQFKIRNYATQYLFMTGKMRFL
jgi:ribonuclease HI